MSELSARHKVFLIVMTKYYCYFFFVAFLISAIGVFVTQPELGVLSKRTLAAAFCAVAIGCYWGARACKRMEVKLRSEQRSTDGGRTQ
jgi:hypothetical protein